jgi:hypothetical protein
VASVDKEELGRPVFGVVGRLLSADGVEVPDVDTAVGRGRGEMDGGVGGPGELVDFIGVGFERVELGLELADVPQADGLQD